MRLLVVATFLVGVFIPTNAVSRNVTLICPSIEDIRTGAENVGDFSIGSGSPSDKLETVTEFIAAEISYYEESSEKLRCVYKRPPVLLFMTDYALYSLESKSYPCKPDLGDWERETSATRSYDICEASGVTSCTATCRKRR